VIFLLSATQENIMNNVASTPPRVNGILETSLYVESPARSSINEYSAFSRSNPAKP
jgi:hypothetical protein